MLCWSTQLRLSTPTELGVLELLQRCHILIVSSCLVPSRIKDSKYINFGIARRLSAAELTSWYNLIEKMLAVSQTGSVSKIIWVSVSPILLLFRKWVVMQPTFSHSYSWVIFWRVYPPYESTKTRRCVSSLESWVSRVRQPFGYSRQVSLTTARNKGNIAGWSFRNGIDDTQSSIKFRWTRERHTWLHAWDTSIPSLQKNELKPDSGFNSDSKENRESLKTQD